MSDGIIDVSRRPARLSVRLGRLVIEQPGEQTVFVPLGEIAALIIAHPQVTVTRAVLSGLASRGAVCVICDESFRPSGMLLPLVANAVQEERFAAQISAALPVRKQLWRQIVARKIRNQALVLERLRGRDFGLSEMSRRVRSGDPENLEAQAARRYWTALFEDPDFRRNPRGEGKNRLLDYGYGVLRAITARAICATGLHPSIGIHHHNRYNPFCLADDLMEPFRPCVDWHVVEIAAQQQSAELTPQTKRRLLGFLSTRFDWGGETRDLSGTLTRLAQNLWQVLAKQRDRLEFPLW